MPNPLLTPYTGNPKDPGKPQDLPLADPDALKDPSHYQAPPELAAAVNVALELGLPLLLTGAPGCGKSRLADAVAYELGLRNEKGEYKAIRYTVKSDTESRDLFYHFDTLGRFRNANDGKSTVREAKEFMVYHGLGLALLRAKTQANRDKLKDRISGEQWQHLEQLPAQGERSVVLIDEIDKAPREVPNDLLTEIEDLVFRTPELGRMDEIQLEKEEKSNRPIVIITSNSERELPPAFLRRCIYFHVEPPPSKQDRPDAPVTIESIVEARLGEAFEQHDRYLQDALSLFRHLQSLDFQQKPSLAELLQWLLYLSRHLPAGRHARLKEHAHFKASLAILLKPHAEHERKLAAEAIQNWKPSD
jgi:MoxR-like ATPase